MSSTTAGEALLLERYKYALDQKKNLNERTFKVASVYQVLALAITTGQFNMVSSARAGDLSRAIAVDASWGLLIIFIVVTLIMSALIAGGIFAWIGYRKDEAEIETLIRGESRSQPCLRDALSWYETYILLAGVIGVGGYTWAMVWKIIPTIIAK